eukprot:3731329-Amphidinium_carterae.1
MIQVNEHVKRMYCSTFGTYLKPMCPSSRTATVYSCLKRLLSFLGEIVYSRLKIAVEARSALNVRDFNRMELDSQPDCEEGMGSGEEQNYKGRLNANASEPSPHKRPEL